MNLKFANCAIYLGLQANAASTKIEMPAVRLPFADASKITMTKPSVQLESRKLTMPFSYMYPSKATAWLSYTGLRSDIMHHTFKNMHKGPTFYSFHGEEDISQKYICFEDRECTIISAWNGKQWSSTFHDNDYPDGWEPLARKNFLAAQPNQIGFSYFRGRLHVQHTFIGPSKRWLVLNEALLASGEYSDRCFWRRSCKALELRTYIRINENHPVGIAGFKESRLQMGH
ncbi:hypothetical protein DSO57_1022325 [Entomophthora muscae]|uniref:Uncharacterized protein n=1 Tax=Entomophthora muscae TaxID=34485 RepID=A0ACC2SFT5_9FUNG|nr:hypothetical protein DSO57_1022325 [Entomophthora muscae]